MRGRGDTHHATGSGDRDEDVTHTVRAEVEAEGLAAAIELGETERLYREHVDFVWRAAGRMGVAPEDRDDVVQDVFVVVHRRRAAFEGRSAITSWLYGIVRGIVWNRNRLRERRGRHLRALATAPTPASDPTADTEAADVLARFGAELDAAQREVFELSELEGMSGPEIADALGVNVNTIYTRLRTARKAFRRFAERELQSPPDDAHGRR
jgi:RNA polymerase sigma-70 factor, ECF subfamily